jgi:hypothetical protein
MQYASCMPRACTVASAARIDTHVAVCIYVLETKQLDSQMPSLSLSLSLGLFLCDDDAGTVTGRPACRERESHMHQDRSKRLVALGPLFTRPCIKIAVSVWLHSDDRCSLILGWDVQWVYHHVMLSSQERSTWCWWTGLVYIQEKWANKKGKRC